METDSNSPEEDPVPVSTVLVSGLGFLGLGMLGGVYRVFHNEKVKFDSKTHGPPMRVASRALLYGTLLCLGTFGVAGSIFVNVSGVKTFRQFGRLVKTTFNIADPIPPSLEDVEEVDKIEGIVRDFFKEWQDKENSSSVGDEVAGVVDENGERPHLARAGRGGQQGEGEGEGDLR